MSIRLAINVLCEFVFNSNFDDFVFINSYGSYEGKSVSLDWGAFINDEFVT